MAVEVRPLGVKCNIQCHYCYQNPQREAGNITRSYDLKTMQKAIEREGGPFILFGGEPLLMPEADLEKLWSWGFKRYGSNRLQTNGVLINDSHIRMFIDYNVHVGISVDGPGELNDARWTTTLKHTRKTSAKTHSAIEKLSNEGIIPTLIVTLHRANATIDKLPKMFMWLLHLESLGVLKLRLHILEVDSGLVREKYALTNKEYLESLLAFKRFENEQLTTLCFDLFDELRSLLLGQDNGTSCVWNACDPYTTAAVSGIEGHGQSSNCGRTNKDGIDFVKANQVGFERYIVLYQTEQSTYGCKDCRFFLVCKGQCPGSSKNGDWRMRSDYCQVWMGLFDNVESQLLDEGLTPISLSPKRSQLEQYMIKNWQAGRNSNIAQALIEVEKTLANSSLRPNSQIAKPQSTNKLTNQLDVKLSDFVRVCWVSDKAKETWGDRLRRIAIAWSNLSWLSVVNGLRRCSIESISTTHLETQLSQWKKYNLHVAAIDMELFTSRPIYHRDPHSERDDTMTIRFAVANIAEDVEKCKAAFRAQDHNTLADLLGYPQCCAESYSCSIANNDVLDKTWYMIFESPLGTKLYEQELAGACEANIFYKQLGIQAVAHLPCKIDCAATAALGRQFINIGRQAGYALEMDWLKEFLSMPVEWSALHGISETKSALLKMISSTEKTPIRYSVRYCGKVYPVESSSAASASPVIASKGAVLIESRGSRRGLKNSISLDKKKPTWYATDNGFRSEQDMKIAHRPIIELAGSILAGQQGNIVDLGCGNGLLLKSICGANPRITPFGIDRELESIEHANLLFPDLQKNFVAGDMFMYKQLWASRRYDCAILMAGRLLAVKSDMARTLKRNIQLRCNRLLVYAYSDSIERHGDLQTIAKKTGLKLETPNNVVSIARFE